MWRVRTDGVVTRRARALGASILLLLLAGCASTPSGEPAKLGKWNPQDFDQAVTLMKAGKYEKAASLLEAIAKVNDQLPGVYINLGISYRKLGRLDDAEQVLQIAIKRDPHNAVAYDELGLVERRLGKFPQARSDYEQSIDQSSDYSKAHLNLGILCDLYIADNRCALKQYEIYQNLTGGQNKTVATWIVDLRQRMHLPIGKAKLEAKK